MADIEEKELEFEQDEADEVNEDFVDLSKQQIITSPSDPNIQTLYGMKKDGDIILQPRFQRKYVWNITQASRLIESILLGFPLPVIYVSENDEGQWVVIDGQQRLTSIFNFLDDKFEHQNGNVTDFKLTSLKVLTKYNKCKFTDLDKEAQRRFKSYSIRVVVISKNSGEDIKFDMFERLNRGSVGLNDMELRNCIYRGDYMETIKEFAKDPLFRKLVGLRGNEPRMKDNELVLRFLAFNHKHYDYYSAPIKKFLNDDCESQRNYTDKQKAQDLESFKSALQLISSIFGEHAFKRFFRDPKTGIIKWEDKKFNVSLFDIYMWVFSRYSSQQDKNLIMQNADLIRETTMDLMIKDELFIDSITRATSGNQQVRTRFDIYKGLINKILSNSSRQPRCYTHEFKEELFKKNPICALCGNKIMNVDDAAVDHIDQYWMGGTTTPENARLAHRYCNNHRSRNDVVTDQKTE